MLLVAGATGATACGDDSGGGSDACTGHLCNQEAQLTDPEGGNIIFEYIYFDSELQAGLGLPGDTATRVMAYFMDAQTPESNPLPMPGKCNDLVANKGWPLWVGTPHTDLDVGTVTFTGKNTAGAASTIPLTKMMSTSDNIGRPHDLFYQNITPNAADLLKADSSYSVTFSGAGTVPATTFTDAVFLPGTYGLGTPAREDNGPLVAGQDFVVTWTPGTSANKPAGDEILGLVLLIDSNGSPTHMCVTDHASGTFTIPGATITEYRQDATARGANPNKVILSRQAVDHRLYRLPNGEAGNLRRIDMLGVNCWVQLMDVSPGA
jgi:hypothetical protein